MIGEFIKIENDYNAKSRLEVGNYLEYEKKKTWIPFQACIIARNTIACDIEGKQQKDRYDIMANFQTNYYRISFWEQSSNISTIGSIANMVGSMIKDKSFDALQETMLPKIFDANENQIGKMEYVTVKKQGAQSYYYHKLILNDTELNCYTIGHDTKEILFVMYDKDDRMVATVSKQMKVKNGKARYTLYLEDDKWFEMVAIATMIESRSYDNNNNFGTQNHALNTFQKGLLDRYDSNYISNIIAKEEPENLPENMPLVAEKVKESQSTAMLQYHRIILSIFIIGFILLFLFLFFK
jgi:hypothetical protein